MQSKRKSAQLGFLLALFSTGRGGGVTRPMLSPHSSKGESPLFMSTGGLLLTQEAGQGQWQALSILELLAPIT